jgi:hypothetical protein
MDELQNIKNQHFDNYKKALIEIIQINTKALVDDDIKSFFLKPPLVSMDIIRNKMLSFAKKNHIILDNEKIDKILDSYRRDVINCCEEIKSLRIDFFSDIINHYKFKQDSDIIVLYKKDFISLNKRIKKIVKDQINNSLNDKLLCKIKNVVSSSAEENKIENFVQEVSNYLKKQYQKQILESFDIKLLVKDTTLINNIKEQGDRFLFTLNHSRLLNQND